MVKKDVSLPSNRAFVIQLYGNSTASRVHHRGRVEHLTSGQATHFADDDEFWAFVDSVVTTRSPNQSDPGG